VSDCHDLDWFENMTAAIAVDACGTAVIVEHTTGDLGGAARAAATTASSS